MEHVLKIEVNGKYLTFYPNAKVKMIRKSPLFLNEADPGSRIYTFTIPAEPNAEILDYANLLFSNKKIVTYDCNVYLKGNFYKKAKLDITGFTKLTFDIRVRFDKPYFAEAAERKLRSFEYNAPTPYRYIKLYNIAEFVRTYSFVSGAPTVDFSFDIQFDAPLMNFAVQTKTFYYSTANPETITELITRVAKWFNDNFKLYGVYCLVIASNKLYFITPYTTIGKLSIVHVLDATALTQMNAPTWPPDFLTMFDVWDESIKLANDTVFNPTNFDYDFVFFPFYAPNGNSAENYRHVVNHFNPNGDYAGFQYGSTGTYLNYRYQGLIPFAFLHKVFEYIHAELGITVEDDFWDDELKTLVYFNNKIFNQTYSTDNAIATNNIDKINSSFKYANLLPNITYKEFVYDLANMFCLVFDYESNDEKLRVRPRKNIIQSSEVIDLTESLNFDYVGETQANTYELNYTWDSAETLAQSRINPNNNLEPKADVIDKPALPTPSLSLKNSIIKTIKENLRYVLEAAATGYRWIFYDESLEDYKPADTNQKITTGLSTLFLNKMTSRFWSGLVIVIKEVTWLLPYTGGNVEIETNENNIGSQRILFYRGLKECDTETFRLAGDTEYTDNTIILDVEKGSSLGTDEGQYPFATYHNYDYKGNKCGNYSLAWNAEDGLVKTWWAEWLAYLDNTYKVTMQFTISTSEFMQMDMLKKIRVENQIYFIDEMEVDLGNEMSIVTARCYIYKTN